jgi:hypothetical protein
MYAVVHIVSNFHNQIRMVHCKKKGVLPKLCPGRERFRFRTKLPNLKQFAKFCMESKKDPHLGHSGVQISANLAGNDTEIRHTLPDVTNKRI